jgi:hypothetical protein
MEAAIRNSVLEERLFKVLRAGAEEPQLTGSLRWIPGVWQELESGSIYTLGYARGEQVLSHLGIGPELWRFETTLKSDVFLPACQTLQTTIGSSRIGKITTRYEAWTLSTMVAWATDCAEHVLPIFEVRFPGDTRPRNAIQAARHGIWSPERAAAAHAAAREASTVSQSAEAAANAAATVIYTAYSESRALGAAYGTAARAAASLSDSVANDAGVSTWAAERRWQYLRLIHYLDSAAAANDWPTGN